jgi:hypothetical protein
MRGPNSTIDLTNGGRFSDAFVGKEVRLGDGVHFRYDTALRSEEVHH